jgi:hypothetical protein
MKHATYVTFAVAWLTNLFFWDLTLCHWVDGSPYFEGSQFLTLQDTDSEKTSVHMAVGLIGWATDFNSQVIL